MPQGSIRVSRPLTNLSVKYTNSEYIANEVLGSVAVKNESDQYWVFDSDRRMEDTLRANGAQANAVNWKASVSSYNVEEHTLKDVITDRDYANADSPLELDKTTSENLIDKILLRQEYDAATLLFTTTTFSNNTTLTSATSWRYNTITSAPILNYLSATGVIIANSGKRPNKIIMGWEVFANLKENANVYGRIQYVEKSILTEEIMASVFDVNMVHVGTSVRETAKEGATSDIGFIWGNDSVIGYFDKKPGLKKITAATNFRVKQYGSPYKVKKYRSEDVEGNWIECQSMYVAKAIATSCGYLFKTVTL